MGHKQKQYQGPLFTNVEVLETLNDRSFDIKGITKAASISFNTYSNWVNVLVYDSTRSKPYSFHKKQYYARDTENPENSYIATKKELKKFIDGFLKDFDIDYVGVDTPAVDLFRGAFEIPAVQYIRDQVLKHAKNFSYEYRECDWYADCPRICPICGKPKKDKFKRLAIYNCDKCINRVGRDIAVAYQVLMAPEKCYISRTVKDDKYIKLVRKNKNYDNELEFDKTFVFYMDDNSKYY